MCVFLLPSSTHITFSHIIQGKFYINLYLSRLPPTKPNASIGAKSFHKNREGNALRSLPPPLPEPPFITPNDKGRQRFALFPPSPPLIVDLIEIFVFLSCEENYDGMIYGDEGLYAIY